MAVGSHHPSRPSLHASEATLNPAVARLRSDNTGESEMNYSAEPCPTDPQNCEQTKWLL